MIHQETPDNSILVIITSVIIQAGVWTSDWFGNVNLTGIYDTIYDCAKLGALIVSMWASYRVAKKNKNNE
jgi:hypothetical protein